MLRPFSDRVRPWEREGMALRQKANVGLRDLLDPWALAPEVGLTMVDVREVLHLLDPGDRRLLMADCRSSWSGGVCPRALPDSTYVCMLNPTHSRRRNKVTLMEEISHIHLDHAPTSLRPIGDGLRARDYDKAQEEVAYGVGAAALIPWQTLYPAMNAGLSLEELSQRYDVTTQLIEYRIKITGAYRFYQSRQRTGVRALVIR
jgi:IrrE N-terminal-like domain